MSKKYAIGVDFGTESGRALLVDVADGREVATAVHEYANGVIDEKLPGTAIRLEPDWALQDPNDYLEVFKQAIPAVLKAERRRPGRRDRRRHRLHRLHDAADQGRRHAAVLPAGVARTTRTPGSSCGSTTPPSPRPTSSTQIAARAGRGVPGALRRQDQLRVVLPQGLADPGRGAGGLRRRRPAASKAADWVIWQLTGDETPQHLHRRLQGHVVQARGLPVRTTSSRRSTRGWRTSSTRRCRATSMPLGAKAGGLTAAMARLDGPEARHRRRGRPTWTRTSPCRPPPSPSRAGWSSSWAPPPATWCWAQRSRSCPACAATWRTASCPGFFGFEAGQSCVGDHFAWFVENCVPAAYRATRRKQRGISIHELLEEKAARLKPGESGLLALDWWNGNRSVLVDVDLTGMLLGATLATKPEEIYRALIEATAYGTRMIIETFEANGVPVNEIVAMRRPARAQQAADADLRRRHRAADQRRRDAPGRRLWARPCTARWRRARRPAATTRSSRRPSDDGAPARRSLHARSRPTTTVYDQLYAEYVTLHDYFGRGANDVMKRLKEMRARILAGA